MCARPWAISSIVKSLACGAQKSNHAPLCSMMVGPTPTFTATTPFFFQGIRVSPLLAAWVQVHSSGCDHVRRFSLKPPPHSYMQICMKMTSQGQKQFQRDVAAQLAANGLSLTQLASKASIHQ